MTMAPSAKVDQTEAVASWQTAGLSSGRNGNGEVRCVGCGHENREGEKFCGQCARPLKAEASAATASPPVPSSIAAGRYEVKRFLGEGAKKRVYLAHDTRLERDVAVAVLKTERIDETVGRIAEKHCIGRAADRGGSSAATAGI
jgi:hypothetical protein